MEYVVLIIAATYFRKIREDAMIAKRLSEIMER